MAPLEGLRHTKQLHAMQRLDNSTLDLFSLKRHTEKNHPLRVAAKSSGHLYSAIFVSGAGRLQIDSIGIPYLRVGLAGHQPTR